MPAVHKTLTMTVSRWPSCSLCLSDQISSFVLHVGRLVSGKKCGTRHPEIVTEVTSRHHREEQIAIAASVKRKKKSRPDKLYQIEERCGGIWLQIVYSLFICNVYSSASRLSTGEKKTNVAIWFLHLQCTIVYSVCGKLNKTTKQTKKRSNLTWISCYVFCFGMMGM